MSRNKALHLEVELLKWLALLALATTLIMLLATRAAGDMPPVEPPRPLPAGMDEIARPMPDVTLTPPRVEFTDPNQQLWTILQHHRDGNLAAAVDGWNEIVLPCDMESWRHVALGAARLRLEELPEAVIELDRAITLDPDNPVAHYFLAIAHLEQARLAEDWYEVPLVPWRFVSWRPPQIVPNTPAMYQLAAMHELDTTLRLAPTLLLDQPLIDPDEMGMSPDAITALPPQVGDVLWALRSEHFEAQSHNMMSYLCLQRGWLEAAERHMDEASALGLTVYYGYDDLAAAYEREEMHLDATRAYMKAMAQGGNALSPARKAWRSLRNAWWDMF